MLYYGIYRLDRAHMITKKSAFGKLAILIFFAITIPAVIQTAVYFVQAETNIRNELLVKTNESINDKSAKILNSLNGSLALVNFCRKDEEIYRYLDHKYESKFDFLVIYQDELKDLFNEYTTYTSQIINAKFYTTNYSLVSGGSIKYLPDKNFRELDDDPIYLNMQSISDEKNQYFRVAQSGNNITKMLNDMDVSFVCALDYYGQYSNFEKYLKFSLDLEAFKEILCESNLFENMFLTDDAGRVIASAKPSELINADLFLDIDALMNEYPVLQRKIDKYPLYLYGVYNDNMISEGFTSSRMIVVGVITASVVIALAVIYFGVFSMKRRVYALVDQSELAKMELEKETNKAKLLALQSQVDPHFMFNALESIRLKAMIKGEKETASMIKYMAKMFRNMINWVDNIIPLRDEITILDDYLHLQKYRFEDEFTYEIIVSEDAKDCKIPRMMLQPLVENASVHGVEAKNDKSWIKLTADVKDGYLTAVVEDCGGGIEPGRLEELRNLLNTDDGVDTRGCVGLTNVYRRLKLYYGKDFSFDIESTLGVGTKVTVKIPEVR